MVVAPRRTGTDGFFATARVVSRSVSRPDWKNRYGAGLASIRLITPAISIAAIQRSIPDLTWAKYPRSITTPTPDVAKQIRALIKRRRQSGLPDLDDDSLDAANIDELRRAALLSARSVVARTKREVFHRARSRAIHLYVLKRAAGHCEACGVIAPFPKTDGTPYLEPHHTTRLADEGPDDPRKVIALCPNCHRRAHHAKDASSFNKSLIRKLSALES